MIMNKIKRRDLIVRKNFKAILIGYVALVLDGIFVALLFWKEVISDREFVFELLWLMGINLFLYFLLDANIQKSREIAE